MIKHIVQTGIWGAILITFCTIHPVISQEVTPFLIPRTNSSATLTQTIASTKIEINYHRPNKRGREIFGSLVPYGKIWRTGSDEATRVYFSTPVQLEGHPVDSGSYELFTIPGPTGWEIILQTNNHQWGSYRYRDTNDVLRFTVAPSTSMATVETFTISLDQIGPDHGVVNIAWDHVVVSVRIKIDLMTTVIPGLEKLLSADGRRPYFQAAMFYYENDIDIDRAADLMALALEQNPGHLGMLYRQALILKRKGDVEAAIASAEQSLKAAQQADMELKAEYTRLNTRLLEELRHPDAKH